MLPLMTSDPIPTQTSHRSFRIWSLELSGTEYLVIAVDLNAPDEAPRLTLAENLVFRGLIQGEPSARIARLLRKSKRTVNHQIGQIYRKFGVRSRAELLFAIHTGTAMGMTRVPESRS